MKKAELKQLVKEEFDKIMEEMEQDQPAVIDGEVDDEGRMVKSELMYIADKAKGCADMIEGDEQQVEAWVQSHITAAKELISHVADYMGYTEQEEKEEEQPEEPETQEAPEQEAPETQEAPEEEVPSTKPIMEAETAQSVQTKKQAYLRAKKDMIDQQLKTPTELEEDVTEEGMLSKTLGPLAMIAALAFGTSTPTQAQTQFASGVVKGAQTTYKMEKGSAGSFRATATVKDSSTGKTYEGVGLSRDMNMAKQKAQMDAMSKMVQNQKSDMKEEKQESPKKVKKSEAQKVKNLGQEMLAKGEHAKMLKMISKLEDYVKNHSEKPEN